MFSEMESIQSRLTEAKGPMCNSRDIAETILTKAGDKDGAKHLNDEFIALHAISSTDLDRAIPALRKFVDRTPTSPASMRVRVRGRTRVAYAVFAPYNFSSSVM